MGCSSQTAGRVKDHWFAPFPFLSFSSLSASETRLDAKPARASGWVVTWKREGADAGGSGKFPDLFLELFLRSSLPFAVESEQQKIKERSRRKKKKKKKEKEREKDSADSD